MVSKLLVSTFNRLVLSSVRKKAKKKLKKSPAVNYKYPKM